MSERSAGRDTGEQPLDPADGGFVGLISDTHGLIRPEASEALAGSRMIVHAGDVGDPDILDVLRRIAPAHAVYGNTDGGELRRTLPATDLIELADGVSAYVIHILGSLDIDPVAAGCAVVVYGHTHEPAVERREGVWYINPGSAGPRRFSLPVTVARLHLDPAGLRAEIVELAVGATPQG